MNKWMLASITVLLAGGLALPADAQDPHRHGGDTADNGRDRDDERAERADPRPVVAQASVRPPFDTVTHDRRNDRWDGRHDRRDRRYDRRDDHRDWRDDRRGWRNDRRDDHRGWHDDHRDWRHDRRDDHRDWRDDRRDWRHDNHHYARGHDRRWNGYHGYPQYRYRAPVRYVYPRGYRSQQWRVGHRLPPAYHHRNHYVDYRSYHLPRPPYGYHWVRVDRDVVLVSIASGLILDILHGLYY